MPGAELLPVGGAPGGYTATFGGTGMQPFGRAWDPQAKKAKPAAHLTWSNWMLEYAQNVRDENARLAGVRRGNVGQVQVGLGVEEDEEDCWEWVEEEYDDDEAVDPSAAAADEVKPSLGGAVDAAPPPALGDFSNGLPSLPPPNAAAAPYPHAAAAAPLDPSLASPFPLPSTSTSSPYPGSPFPPSTSSSAPAPAPGAPAPFAPPALPPARPKKRRLVRVYTPIRGVYDPETNVPHVYRATQPRRVVDVAQVDKRPRLGERERAAGERGSGMELDGEGEDEAQSERRREAARRAGLASVELVSDARAWALEVELPSAGGSAVEAALASRAGREDLVPGSWDFLELARQEGLVV